MLAPGTKQEQIKFIINIHCHDLRVDKVTYRACTVTPVDGGKLNLTAFIKYTQEPRKYIRFARTLQEAYEALSQHIKAAHTLTSFQKSKLSKYSQSAGVGQLVVDDVSEKTGHVKPEEAALIDEITSPVVETLEQDEVPQPEILTKEEVLSTSQEESVAEPVVSEVIALEEPVSIQSETEVATPPMDIPEPAEISTETETVEEVVEELAEKGKKKGRKKKQEN